MKLLFCGSGWFPIVDAIQRGLPDDYRVDIWDRDTPLVEALADVQVILPSNAVIDAAAIAAPADLRLIQQPAAGIDTVDRAAAAARGVPVCNAPAANHLSVAEAATYMMLALARRAPEAARAFARREIGLPLGIELSGKTLGIVGLGRAGRALAEIAGGLGMRVVSVTSSSTPSELDALLAESDVISLHCPLTDRTRNLIDAAALARMKSTALVVNCARGDIIDRAALIDALDRGAIAGVGLDTFWDEPPDPGDPLYERLDVVTLPHVAGSTRESFARIADIVCENVLRVARGERPLHQLPTGIDTA